MRQGDKGDKGDKETRRQGRQRSNRLLPEVIGFYLLPFTSPKLVDFVLIELTFS